MFAGRPGAAAVFVQLALQGLPGVFGLGTVFEFDADLVVADPELPLAEGAIEPWRKNGKRMNIFYNRIIRKFCKVRSAPRRRGRSCLSRSGGS